MNAETIAVIETAFAPLLDVPRWLVWAYRPNKKDPNKRDKVPFIAAGRRSNASSTNSATWRPWASAKAHRNRADQKQADAIELLSHVRAVRQAQPGPKQVSFAFRHTDAFDQLRRHTGDRLAEPGAAEAEIEPVLDELRLRGDRSYRRARQQALVRALALWILEAEGITVDAEALSLQVERFRRQHRLASGDDIASWLEGAGLGIDDLSRLLSDEARIDRVLSLVAGDLPLRLVEHLRLAGVYRTLCQRALDKRACLADHGCKQPTLADAGINEEQLLAWHFGTRLGPAPPSDLEVYARLLDLADVDHLRRLLLAEYCYRRLDGSLGEGR